MKTENLIRTLAADPPPHSAPPALSFTIAILAGLAVSAAGFVLWLGPREDVAQAATTFRFLLKPAEMLALSLLAGMALFRLAVPGMPARISVRWLAAVPVFVALAALVEFATARGDEWRALLVGDNALKCLTLIPLLSAPLASTAAEVPVE